jgi:hypothetical protein
MMLHPVMSIPEIQLIEFTNLLFIYHLKNMVLCEQ